MFELKVMSGGSNIALGKSTSQSSTYKNNEAQFGSANAVDNNQGTFSHTDANAVGLAWYELNLGSEQNIDSITIFNKWCTNSNDQPGCLCRMSNAVISLVNDLGQTVATKNLGDTCGKSEVSSVYGCGESSSPTPSPANGGVSCGPQASVVKVQSLTDSPLSFFEVQVLSSGINVAEGKSASQQSTYQNNDSKFGAGKAVDGAMTTFSHTDVGGCASWQVNLGGSYSIDSLLIHNRNCGSSASDPCLCRLSHAAVSLFDQTGQLLTTILIGDMCGKYEWQHVFQCPPV